MIEERLTTIIMNVDVAAQQKTFSYNVHLLRRVSAPSIHGAGLNGTYTIREVVRLPHVINTVILYNYVC